DHVASGSVGLGLAGPAAERGAQIREAAAVSVVAVAATEAEARLLRRRALLVRHHDDADAAAGRGVLQRLDRSVLLVAGRGRLRGVALLRVLRAGALARAF